MRKVEGPQEPNFVILTDSYGGGVPFAYPVHGKNGRVLKRAGKECAGRVSFMVAGEEQASSEFQSEFPADNSRQVKLRFKPKWHGFEKRPETPRSVGQVGLEQSVKFEQRLVVKDHVFDVPGSQLPSFKQY